MDAVAPILRCKQLGYNESSIVIDTILSNHDEIAPVNLDNSNTVGMLLRVWEVYSYYSAKAGLMRAQRLFPAIDFRYVIGPKNTPSIFELVPIVSTLLINYVTLK